MGCAFRRFLPLLVSAVGLPAMSSGAAVPEPPIGANKPAAPDTSHFLPPWLHLHGSLGYGWIQGPQFIRRRYEPGQDIELGLETRLRKNLRLRLNGEYQILPAVGNALVQFVSLQNPDGSTRLDTLSFEWRGRGWMLAPRAELQWRALPHTWLMAGGGRGYLDAGIRPFHFADPFETLDITFPGSTGWGWLRSAGIRYDFDLFGPVLGAELRYTNLHRRQDDLDMLSLRIGWMGR